MSYQNRQKQRKKRLRLSDHALIRYMERVLMVDMESIRRDAAKQVKKASRNAVFEHFEACQVSLPNGVKAVIDKGKVVTFLR